MSNEEEFNTSAKRNGCGNSSDSERKQKADCNVDTSYPSLACGKLSSKAMHGNQIHCNN